MNYNMTIARGEALIELIESHGYTIIVHEAQVSLRGNDNARPLPPGVGADVTNYRGSIAYAIKAREAKAKQAAEMAALEAVKAAKAAEEAATALRAQATEDEAKAAAEALAAAQAAADAKIAAEKAATDLAETQAMITAAVQPEQAVDPVINTPGFNSKIDPILFGTE